MPTLPFSTRAFLLSLSLVCAFCDARAQDADTAGVDLPSVSVQGIKSPIEYPYQKAYDATRKVLSGSNGLAELVFTLTDKAPITAPKLRLTLEYDDTVTEIPLDAARMFRLKPDAAAAAAGATLVVNRHKKDIEVNIELVPVLGSETLTVAHLDTLVDAGRGARRLLLPWYARIVISDIQGLRICSGGATGPFSLRDAQGTETPLTSATTTDAKGHTATCHDYRPTTGVYSTTSRLVAPLATGTDRPAELTVHYL
jgi:hypothetical protein